MNTLETNKLIDLYMNCENKEGFIPKGFEVIYPRYDVSFDALVPVGKKCLKELDIIRIKLNPRIYKENWDLWTDCIGLSKKIQQHAFDMDSLYSSVVNAIQFINTQKIEK